MLFLNNFKAILVLAGVLLIVVLAITLSLPKPSPQTTPQQTVQIPIPTSFPELAPPSISPAPINNVFNSYSEEYKKQAETIVNQEQSIHDQALTVSKFVDSLPFSGKFIKVTYNIYNNQIYLEYPAANKAEALQEFVDLLKANKIENINWLYNLKIIER